MITRYPWQVLLALALLMLCAASHGMQQEGGKLFTPPTEPTEVGVRIIVLDVDGIDSSQQIFTTNVAMMASWHDPRLAGTVEEPTVMPLGDVWHPNLQAINQQRIWRTMAPVVVVYPDGKVVQRQRAWGDFSQPLDLHEFPLDVQSFFIRVGSAGYGPGEIRFVPNNETSGIADELSLADWEILGHELIVEPYSPFKGLNPIASVAFRIDAQRLRGYYILKILLPLLLIVGMSYLVYWIPISQTSTRISVSVTAMLTLIAYRFMIGGLLPKVSYMTRLDNFVMLSTVLVFVTLLVAATVGAWEGDKPERAHRANSWAKVLFPLVFIGITAVAFRLDVGF